MESETIQIGGFRNFKPHGNGKLEPEEIGSKMKMETQNTEIVKLESPP